MQPRRPLVAVLVGGLAVTGCHLLLPLGPGPARDVRPAGPSDRAVDAGDFRVPGTVSPDPSFAGQGYITVDGFVSDEDYAAGAAIDPQGRIVVVGQITNSTTLGVPNKDAVVWRFLPDGGPDPSFGSKGRIVMGQSNWDFARSVAFGPKDTIVVGGNMEWSQRDAPTVWRFLPSGAPDPSFGTSGTGNYTVSGREVAGTDMAADRASGESVVLGNEHDHIWISVGWFAANGALRLPFGGDGHVEAAPPATPTPSGARLRIDGSGRVVVVGSSRPGGIASDLDLTVWRFLPNGALDQSFGPARGYLIHDGAAVKGGDEAAADLDLDGAGNLYVCGTSAGATASQVVVWKVRPDGSLDPRLGGQGFVLAAGPFTVGSACRLDASGRLLIAGTRMNNQGNAKLTLWRLLDDGGPDPTFPPAGYPDQFPGKDEQVRSLTLDGDKRAIVCGNVGLGVASDMAVWRLLLP